jgi:hypothetical protein
MIDPFFNFGIKNVWSLTTMVHADGVCLIMEYSIFNQIWSQLSKKDRVPI